MLSNVFVPVMVDASIAAETPNPLKCVEEKDKMNFRDISCDTGIITCASGSAFFSFGDTKVYCAVYGPRANQRGSTSGTFSDTGLLECDVRFAAANSHILSSSSEPRMTQQLRDAIAPSLRLSRYPKAVISIYAVVVQSAGGELAAVISCASLALADASIELNDLVSATTVGLRQSENKLIPIVDPCKEEYGSLVSVLTLSAMIKFDSRITHLSVEGFLHIGEFAQLISVAKAGCIHLRSLMADSMKRRQLRHEAME